MPADREITETRLAETFLNLKQLLATDVMPAGSSFAPNHAVQNSCVPAKNCMHARQFVNVYGCAHSERLT